MERDSQALPQSKGGMTDAEKAALQGQVEAAMNIASLLLAGQLRNLSGRDRALALELARYPFQPAAEHETADRPALAQHRQRAMLSALEQIADQAERFAGAATD